MLPAPKTLRTPSGCMHWRRYCKVQRRDVRLDEAFFAHDLSDEGQVSAHGRDHFLFGDGESLLAVLRAPEPGIFKVQLNRA